jgi:hypothetical protein
MPRGVHDHVESELELPGRRGEQPDLGQRIDDLVPEHAEGHECTELPVHREHGC